MNSKNNLKDRADDLGIVFAPGRVDSVSYGNDGVAEWGYAEKAITTLSEGMLAEAARRLEVIKEGKVVHVESELSEQFNIFRFSWQAVDIDEVTWISDGKSFEDDFHRSAWILAGCGVVQAACLVCKGFDIPSSI